VGWFKRSRPGDADRRLGAAFDFDTVLSEIATGRRVGVEPDGRFWVIRALKYGDERAPRILWEQPATYAQAAAHLKEFAADYRSRPRRATSVNIGDLDGLWWAKRRGQPDGVLYIVPPTMIGKPESSAPERRDVPFEPPVRRWDGIEDAQHLIEADLRGADLRRRDLRYKPILGAKLSFANLSGANLGVADLSNADLSNAILAGANLEDVTLYDANLTDADLTGANLQRVHGNRANLYGAHLRNADLRDSTFLQSNMQTANLEQANFQGADLSQAIIASARARKARFVSANLSRAILNWSDFTDADMTNAILRGGSMKNTDFTGATLLGADAIPAALEEAVLCRTTLPDGSITYKNCESNRRARERQ
jgi:uncharacterized protein YjbI with pentapeptide repeats